MQSQYVPNVQREPEMRISKEQGKSLSIFSKDELLKILRKVFYQYDLNTKELDFIKSIPQETVKVLRKVFMQLPEVDDPIFGQVNYWNKDNYAKTLATFLSNEAKALVLARQDAIDFMEKGVRRIEEIVIGGADLPLEIKIDLRLTDDFENLPAEQVKRKVVAHDNALTMLESGLFAIKGYANTPSDEETKERIKKDENK